MGLLQRVKGLATASSVSSTAKDANPTPSIASPTTTPEHVQLEVTQLTGEDKVIGPTAPVPDFAEKHAEPLEKNASAEDGALTGHGDKEVELAPEGSNSAEHEVVGTSSEEKKDGEEKEDETIYPGGAALSLLTFGLCMATFVIALDNTIIGK